jgi:hypothetical protein
VSAATKSSGGNNTAVAALRAIIGGRCGVFDVACPECGPECKSPVNQRRPVLRIWRRDHAFLSFNCARCGWQGSDVLGLGTTFLPRKASARVNPVDAGSGAERSARALALWAKSLRLPGTVAETYLSHRGIFLDDDILAADALRFLAACPFAAERHPAMLALMRDIKTNEPKAIHRTALKPDGEGKAEMADGGNPKRMLGPAHGCAVKLIDDADVTIGLGIAEGIENALTAICAGWRPVWAAGCKGAVAKFPVLAGVETLTIFTDPEPGGIEAARECAIRWRDAGLEAALFIPPGGDWNDVGRTP